MKDKQQNKNNNDDNDNETTTKTVIFPDNEFPPLKPSDEGWELVDRNYDKGEPYSTQHQQEKDWECIIDGQQKKNFQEQNILPLYAQVAQEALTLPMTLPSSSSSKKSTLERTFKRPLSSSSSLIMMIPTTSSSNKENEDHMLEEDIGNELFIQYKSASSSRRRHHRRLNYIFRHHAHKNPLAFPRQPTLYQRDQQHSTNEVLTKNHFKYNNTSKRRSRTKQPTKTWIEREIGWVAIHAKIHSK
ncbi:hypothetical protein INT45_007581 [Circinella minor]|uniref:Uncharacterized protein n=1 Tax=Circinella minor TaxID=1195481 RepID=A0A8H7S3Q8_9FUNG|nr:hypothetical protein INT45_007581 [Circinella minor]